MSTVTLPRLRTLLVDSRALTVLLFVVSVSALAVPAFLIQNAYTVVLPLSTLAASLLGIYYHYRPPSPLARGVTVESIPVRAVYALWFAAFAMAVALYTAHGFTRSLSVNALLVCLYLLSIGAIFFTDRNSVALGFLLVTGLVHRGLIYFVNPLPYGIDPHYHYGNAHFIAAIGTLEPLRGTKELVAPFYHVAGAVGSLLLGVPVRQGALFLVLVVTITVVTTLVVYHLTASFWSTRAGLFASALYLAGDHSAGDLLALGTTELGLVFFVLVLYGVVWYVQTESNRHLAVFLVAFFALTFTHHGSVFVIASAVIAFSFAAMLVRGVSSRFVNVSILSGTILFFNWTATSFRDGGDAFLDWILINLLRHIRLSWSGEGGPTPEMFGFVSAAPMASSGYLDVFGTGLLFFLGASGVLYWVSFGESDTKDIVVLLSTVMATLLGVMFVGSVMGIPSLVPSRWFKHIYILLAVPAGVGLLGVLSLLPRRVRSPSTLLACLVVLSLPYLILMGGSIDGSPDDPIFDTAPGAERMSYTPQEVATTQHSLAYATVQTDVLGDHVGRAPLRWDRTETAPETRRIRINIDNDEPVVLPDRPTMVITREYMYSGHTVFDIWSAELETGIPMTVRGEVPVRHSTLEGYSKIYDVETDTCPKSCGLYLFER